MTVTGLTQPSSQSNYRITGNSISGNVISGNAGDGVQSLGMPWATSLTRQATSGPERQGHRPTATEAARQRGNGVYLNNAGTANSSARENVISGNQQSGVMIVGTTGDGGSTPVEGNDIGTDGSGSFAIANSGNGVFIYGSSNNIIGGTTATPGSAPGNLISGNAQAGVAIFSPAPGAPASGNVVAGNEIGTNAAGSKSTGSDGKPLGNQSDGVDIFSGQSNTIGQIGQVGSRNVISGNNGNGILITKLSNVELTGNLVNQNYIGTDANGTSALPNGNDGVLVQNAYGNTIGVPSSGVIQNAKVPRRRAT